MKRIIPIALALLLLCAVFGCSGKAASQKDSYYEYSSSAYVDAEYAMEAPAEAMNDSYGFREESKSETATAPALSNRKIIRNANMTVETLAFDTFVDQLTAFIGSFGGYVESAASATAATATGSSSVMRAIRSASRRNSSTRF